MGYSTVLAKRALRGPWQCNDCKICIVCEDAGDPVSLRKTFQKLTVGSIFYKMFFDKGDNLIL